MNCPRILFSSFNRREYLVPGLMGPEFASGFFGLLRPMKCLIYFSFILFTLLFSCAKEQPYVKTPPPLPPPRKVILPKALEYYEVYGERYYPLSDAEGFVQYGIASWYGPKFHGRPTSSGQVFDMYQKTAAHKTLPLFTVVKVINLSNQKSIVVPINDRGPFVKGREIDLSFAAAEEIGLTGPGLAEVKIMALGREVGMAETGGKLRPVVEILDFKGGEFTVQVGAFQNKENALRLADRMKSQYAYVNVTPFADGDNQIWHKVFVSKTTTLDRAAEIERNLERLGFSDAFVVRF
jgi:rare lipoprotein A